MGLANKFNLVKEEALLKASEAKKLQEDYTKNLQIDVDKKTKSINTLVETLDQGFMIIDKDGGNTISQIYVGPGEIGRQLYKHLEIKK